MTKILGFLLCLISVSAWAASPVFSIVPNGALPTTVIPGSTATASYIVTNNSIYTLKGNGLSYAPQGQTPAGVTQVTTGSGVVCGTTFNLAPNGSCTLNLLITAQDLVNGQAIGGPEICNTPANPIHCSLPDEVNRLNITLFPPTFVVGQGGAGPDALFIQILPASDTWTLGPTPGGIPSNSNFSYAACASDLCVIAGGSFFGGPLIISSSANNVWTQASLGSSVTELNGASCSPSALGICVAAGITNVFAGYNLALYQYTASTPSWHLVSLGGAVGSFRSVLCTTTLCIAAGDNGSGVPALYQTKNSGTSWSLVTPGGTIPAPNAIAYSIGNDGVNYLAMYNSNSGSGLSYALSSNSGVTWNWVTVTGNPQLIPQATSCYTGTCYSGGYNSGSSNTLLYKAVTPYGAGNWSLVTLPGSITGVGQVKSISCTSTNCVAVGYTTSAGAFILQNAGGGAFTDVTPLGLGAASQFVTSSCNSAYCVAAGIDNTGSVGLLFESFDYGATWTQVDLTTISGFPVTSSLLGSNMPQTTTGTYSEKFYFNTSLDSHTLWKGGW